MTVNDVKKQFLALIDEYAPENIKFTEDEDADVKFKTLLGLAYQAMANKKPIEKTKNLNHEYTGENVYREYNLPSMKQLRRIIVQDENNRLISGDYYFVGERKIYINQNSNATYIAEYLIEPEVINDETDDDFELEIAQDAQFFLAYKIADDILKTDPSANYTAFANEYQRLLQDFDTRTKGIMVEIDEGEAF